MTKPISRVGHAFIEYPFIATVTTAPKLLGFLNEPRAVTSTRALAAAALTSTIMTRAEWGFLRVMPYKMHVAGDVIGGVAAIAAPWVMGFSHNTRARNFFLAVGSLSCAVGLLSEPEEMP